MDFEFEDKPESKDRRSQMGQEQSRMSNLVDTTDCLEAVSAIKFWKNFLFLIILLSLLLVQGSFWVMNLHLVKGDGVVLGPPVGEFGGRSADGGGQNQRGRQTNRVGQQCCRC